MSTRDNCFQGRVERLVAGGDGLVVYGGKPYFVPFSAPQDRLLLRITEDHSSFGRAAIEEIIEPSPLRTTPRCSLYGQCGGCSLQHIQYEAQLTIKKDILTELFQRIGKGMDIPPIRTIACQPYGYRHRIQLHTTAPTEKHSPVGFKAFHQEKVVAVTDCPICHSTIQRALQKKEIHPPPGKDRFTVFSWDTILFQEETQTQGKIVLKGKTFYVDAGVFFQSNLSMLELLIEELIEITRHIPHHHRAADLYCGVGTFGAFLREYFSELDLLESSEASLFLAKKNIQGAGIRYFLLRDEAWAHFQTKNPQKYDLVVVDPPRQGLSPAMRTYLTQNGPPFLVYVSCDGPTLVRDCKELTKGGYTIEHIGLYDFYPQTAHMECLAFLRKK
ncbi:MAG: methyltransferase [Treponemataceae bacterium]|nr:methyltransferase [Treponemataceae bacterium]